MWQNHMLVVTQPVMGQPQPTWPKSRHQPVKGQILVTLSYTCTSYNINSICLNWNYVIVIRLWYIIAIMFVKYGSNTIQSRYLIAFSRQMLRGGNPHARPWWWDISQFAWWYDIHMLMFSYYIWSCDSNYGMHIWPKCSISYYSYSRSPAVIFYKEEGLLNDIFCFFSSLAIHKRLIETVCSIELSSALTYPLSISHAVISKLTHLPLDKWRQI